MSIKRPSYSMNKTQVLLACEIGINSTINQLQGIKILKTPNLNMFFQKKDFIQINRPNSSESKTKRLREHTTAKALNFQAGVKRLLGLQ
jgi:hypothetical protein